MIGLTKRHMNVLEALCKGREFKRADELPNGHGHCGPRQMASLNTLSELERVGLIRFHPRHGYRALQAGRDVLSQPHQTEGTSDA